MLVDNKIIYNVLLAKSIMEARIWFGLLISLFQVFRIITGIYKKC